MAASPAALTVGRGTHKEFGTDATGRVGLGVGVVRSFLPEGRESEERSHVRPRLRRLFRHHLPRRLRLVREGLCVGRGRGRRGGGLWRGSRCLCDGRCCCCFRH